jgi:PEGA domain
LRKRSKIIPVLILLFSVGTSAQTVDSLKIGYNYINTVPQDAIVYINSEEIGRSPLFFVWQDSVFPKVLRISKNGYVDYTENVTDHGRYNKQFYLVPNPETKPINPVTEDKGPYFKSERKMVPIVLSSVTAIAAGISAFYFKSLAIENKEYFDETGDLQALDRRKKYDLYGGLCILVFQAGLGALLYYLLVD